MLSPKLFKMKGTQLIALLGITLFVATSCKTIQTTVTIPEKSLPATFSSTTTDTSTIAAIDWRRFFDDENLIALIDSTLINNFDLQIALQKIEIARAGIKIAKGALLPQLGANVNGGMRRFGLYTMDGAGNISTEMLPGKIVPVDLPDIFLGVQSSWEIDVWGKLKNQKRAAQAQFLSSIEGTRFIITSLISEISIAYYELIALDNELDIIQQTIHKQEEALEIIKIQKEAGRANELGVQQFNAQLLSSKALERETLQKIIETENRINFLAGRFPQTIIRNKQSLFTETPQQIATGIPSQLLQNRPDIKQAEFRVAASRFDVKSARAAFYPSFNITASLGYQAFNPEYLFRTPASIAYTALGHLTAPVVNRNAIKARFNEAKSNQLQAMYAYQQTIINSYMEVTNELSNIANLQQISIFKQEQSTVLLQAVDIATELYKSGKATYLEVLLAQQNALQSNLELMNVNKQQLITHVKIYKALGGGWR